MNTFPQRTLVGCNSPRLYFAASNTLLRDDSRSALFVPPETAHVWAFELTSDRSEVSAFLDTLSADEVARSRRLMRQEDCTNFIVAHGVLRNILARYCGVKPVDLCFSKGKAGKPLVEPSRRMSICPAFNMTHSAGRALVAIHGSGDVGIDLEHEQERLDPVSIAARHFRRSELEEILASPESERRAVFLRFWVAKEAVLKAFGVGIDDSFDKINLCWDAEGLSASVASFGSDHTDACWTVRPLVCGPGWHAAIAARSRAWTISTQDISGFCQTESSANA